jgi:hypothetical protein
VYSMRVTSRCLAHQHKFNEAAERVKSWECLGMPKITGVITHRVGRVDDAISWLWRAPESPLIAHYLQQSSRAPRRPRAHQEPVETA